MANFSSEIKNFAQIFADMQLLRYSADYDPDGTVPAKAEVIQFINEAETAIRRFSYAPIVERRAFAVHALMNARRS